MPIRYPCALCQHPVRNNQNSLLCVSCGNWCHLKCTKTSKNAFTQNCDWICERCIFNELPFLDCSTSHNQDNDNDPNIMNNDNLTDHVPPPKKVSHYIYSNFEETLNSIRNKSGLHFVHLNVCSLYKCIDEIRLMFSDKSFDVLTFSETMLDSSIPVSCVNIEGYSIIRKDRNRHGGGVIAYVKHGIDYQVRNDLGDNQLELIILQVNPSKQKSFLLCTWYRPPNSQLVLFDKLNRVFQDIEASGLDLVLIGDLNCDVMNSRPSCHTNRLLSIAENFNLTQVITKPTRITKSSSSTIDLIFTSNSEKVSFSEVVQLGLSDHYMIVGSWGNARTRVHEHKFVTSRNVKNVVKENFLKDLQNETWSEVYSENDVEKSYQYFKSSFKNIIDKHAPLKTKRIRQKE